MQNQGKTEPDPASSNGAFEIPAEAGMVFQLADGTIQACNPQAEQLLGLTAKQIQGCTSIDFPWQIVHEDGSPFLGETHPAMVALQTGQPCLDIVMGFCQPTGDLIWLNVSSNPLFLANSAIPYAVVTTFVEALPEQAERVCVDQFEEQNRFQSPPEERYRSLFESIEDGFCLIEMLFDENDRAIDYRFLEVNPAFENQTGLTQAIGKTMRQLVPDIEDHWAEIYGNVALTGEPLRFENISEVMNRWFDVYAFRFGQSDREVAIFFKDISDRKRAELALHAANQKISSILESITDAFIAFDFEWRFTYVNQAAERLLQRLKADLLGQSVWELFPAEERVNSISYQELHRSIAEQIPVNFEYFSPSLNLYLEANAYPSPEGIAIYWRDISDRRRIEDDRKRIEGALQKSEARFQTFMNNGSFVAFMKDESGRLLYANQRLAEMFGLSVDEMLDKREFDVLPEPISAQIIEHDREVLATGKVCKLTETIPDPDGNLTHWLTIKFPVVGEDGQTVLGGISIEISDRVRIEEELRQKNAILNVINESAPTPIFVKDRQGRIIYANPATLAVLGKTAEEVVGCFDSDLYPSPENAARVMENDRRIMESGQTEVVEESPDGIRTFLGMKAPYRNESGEVIGLIGISNDISDRVQVERDRERILQQEQAARETAERANRIKDEFLAVLSHELRTPLNPILGWSKLLQTGKLDAEKSAAALATIERNAKLQSQLIEDLLDVSRILQGKLSLNQVPVSLTTTIEAALETVRLSAEAKNIQMQTRLDPNVGQVSGDAGRLQQVMWNLLSNAVKFTPTSGRVEIRLMRIDRQAQIQVIDTGKGIQADFLPYVFEHFRQEDGATTRKFGGLGLGLAIVKQLVELHGGTIQADSPGEGQGATFTLQLPCLPQSHEPIAEAFDSTSGDYSLLGLRILVVDDDEDSREFVSFVLEQEGATVKTATGAIAALQILAQASFDLLVSDIGMPEMDGYTLIQQIRRHPEYGQIPAIALTAYAGEANERQVLQAGFQQHLAKPIDPAELVARLRQVIGMGH
ncbi:PAS domain-containing protein [Phormidesmis priestleyi]